MATDVTVAAPEPAPPAARTRRDVIFAWIRRLLVALVLVGAAHQLVVQWPEVSTALRTIPWHALLLSLLSVAGMLWLGPIVWRMVVSDVGSPVRMRDASMI